MPGRRMPIRYRLYRARPLMAYVLIVAFTLVGFYRIGQNDRAITRQSAQTCEQAKANRQAIRQVYVDVANIGRDLITTSPSRTVPAKQEAVRRFDAFQRDRIAALPPLTPDCIGDVR